MPGRYDLEERTVAFAKNVRRLVALLPGTIANKEDARQLVRSAGSVGANYIEANESLSRKDFIFRAKIARKEAKETRYWLTLIDPKTGLNEKLRQSLVDEATQLLKILSSIVNKCE